MMSTVRCTGSPGVSDAEVTWQTGDEGLGRQWKAIWFLAVTWLLRMFYLNLSLLDLTEANQRSSWYGQKNSHCYLETK